MIDFLLTAKIGYADTTGVVSPQIGNKKGSVDRIQPRIERKVIPLESYDGRLAVYKLESVITFQAWQFECITDNRRPDEFLVTSVQTDGAEQLFGTISLIELAFTPNILLHIGSCKTLIIVMQRHIGHDVSIPGNTGEDTIVP